MQPWIVEDFELCQRNLVEAALFVDAVGLEFCQAKSIHRLLGTQSILCEAIASLSFEAGHIVSK